MQKKIVFGFLLVLFLAWSACAADPIMPLSEVKPGMKGIAKTVIHGEKIETFDVEILDILPGNKEKNKLILIKVSGPVIEETGGIASGMSGSPVYINGRIIGAVGYGFELSNHRIGMVTPIEYMLRVGKLADKIMPVANNKIKPLAAPLLVNGLSSRALADLAESLEPLNLKVMQGGGSGSVTTKEKLQPGSAVGVQLARGYIEAGAVGTVSYIDGNNILAFGHSFLNKGSIDFPLATAYVHQVISNLSSPFKLASNGQIVGRMLQDRTAGVAGRLNEKAPLTLVRLQVTDHDTGKTARTYFEVVKSQELAVPLITSGLLGLMDNSLDRKGKGTSKVSFSFKGSNLTEGLVARENMFYSDSDIAAVSLLEASEVLSMIVNNVYQDIDLAEIAVKVDVEEQRRTATVQKAEVKKKTVKPGEKLDVEVTYIPYRGRELVKIMSVDIPKDMPEGELNLNVYGGNLPPVEIAKVDLSNAAMITPAPLPYKNLAEMLKEFLQTDKNNEIIIEEMRPAAKVDEVEVERKKETGKKMALGELRDDTAKLILPVKGVESGNKIKSTWASHYIMEGYANVSVTVKK